MKDTIIKLRATQQEKQAWTHRAAKKRMSLSEWIRYLAVFETLMAPERHSELSVRGACKLAKQVINE